MPICGTKMLKFMPYHLNKPRFEFFDDTRLIGRLQTLDVVCGRLFFFSFLASYGERGLFFWNRSIGQMFVAAQITQLPRLNWLQQGFAANCLLMQSLDVVILRGCFGTLPITKKLCWVHRFQAWVTVLFCTSTELSSQIVMSGLWKNFGRKLGGAFTIGDLLPGERRVIGYCFFGHIEINVLICLEKLALVSRLHGFGKILQGKTVFPSKRNFKQYRNSNSNLANYMVTKSWVFKSNYEDSDYVVWRRGDAVSVNCEFWLLIVTVHRAVETDFCDRKSGKPALFALWVARSGDVTFESIRRRRHGALS